MNPRRVLIFSLGLNLALAAALLALGRPRTAPTNVQSVHPGIPATADPVSTPPVASAAPTPSTITAPFHWRSIESADYRQYVANLRDIGCPEATLRDIIVSDLDQLYAAKGKSRADDPPPWHSFARRQSAARTHAQKLAALRAEKRALVRELIGYEWDHEANEVWHEDFSAGMVLGFLPDAKALQLMALVGTYNDLAGDVREAANNILIDEDRVRLRKLYDDLLAEASRVLTPAEFDELQLRIQAGVFLAANNVRWDGITITGAEFREFTRLSRAFKDMYQIERFGIGNLSEEEEVVRGAAFDKQIKNLLGPQRFAEYQRAQDQSFRDVFEFAQERSLPAVAAIRIYDTRRAAEEQAGLVKRDASLSPDEQAAALAILKTTAARTVSSALGNAYRDYLDGPGQWLENLAPAATTASNPR